VAGGGIDWSPCVENPALDCATVQVPIDHQQPQGEQFGMAVIRARATGPGARIGVLVTNPGGPGLSGVNHLLAGVAFQAPIITRLREQFDVVSFDPRGAERSRAVECDLRFDAPPSVPDEALLEQFFKDLGRRYARSCEQRSGAFVYSLGVNNVARDMDRLRAALGEATLSYAGASFGTQLGAVYASMYPQRVRALVLDAGIAPDTGGDALMDFWAEHGAAFELAFARLDRLCRDDRRCPLHATGVRAGYDELAARLKAHPAVHNGQTLSHLALSQAVSEALYVETRWPTIAQALHAALAGRFGPLHKLLRSSVLPQQDGLQALVPSLCGSYASRLSPGQTLAFNAELVRLYPRFQYFRAAPALLPSDQYGLTFPMALCSAWPTAEPVRVRNLRDHLAHPPLLITNDFDNATPPSWTRSLAGTLGFEDAVLRYRGGGHGAITSGLPCIDDALMQYLVNLSPPAPGASCEARPLVF
jgi:pimeloyl-ACP methyl ester carboxylesterase